MHQFLRVVSAGWHHLGIQQWHCTRNPEFFPLVHDVCATLTKISYLAIAACILSVFVFAQFILIHLLLTPC